MSKVVYDFIDNVFYRLPDIKKEGVYRGNELVGPVGPKGLDRRENNLDSDLCHLQVGELRDRILNSPTGDFPNVIETLQGFFLTPYNFDCYKDLHDIIVGTESQGYVNIQNIVNTNSNIGISNLVEFCSVGANVREENNESYAGICDGQLQNVCHNSTTSNDKIISLCGCYNNYPNSECYAGCIGRSVPQPIYETLLGSTGEYNFDTTVAFTKVCTTNLCIIDENIIDNVKRHGFGQTGGNFVNISLLCPTGSSVSLYADTSDDAMKIYQSVINDSGDVIKCYYSGFENDRVFIETPCTQPSGIEGNILIYVIAGVALFVLVIFLLIVGVFVYEKVFKRKSKEKMEMKTVQTQPKT